MIQPHACWFLSGPTASGKTELGLEMAKRLGAEIISLDSMALYRQMDIGTAKPSLAARGRVPHHLVDVIEPSEEFSVAQYVDAAQQAIDDIAGRGRQVLFVGGTPLFLKALLRGLFRGPPADWELRHRLQRLAQQSGPETLHQELAKVDPAAAERLHPNDTRRVIRALEVHEKTGRPISDWQQQFDKPRARASCRVFVLQWPRDALYARIDLRVDSMFEQGLVAETRAILSQCPTLSRTAGQALGYREVIAHLGGEQALPETIELVKTRTRQFAKRQLTWFRSLEECRGVTMPSPLAVAELAGEMITSAPSFATDPPRASSS